MLPQEQELAEVCGCGSSGLRPNVSQAVKMLSGNLQELQKPYRIMKIPGRQGYTKEALISKARLLCLEDWCSTAVSPDLNINTPPA
jgi:hypothetical protein